MNCIRELRDKRGYTQEDLARLLSVSYVSVIHWEAGTRDPNWKHILQLSEVLGVDVYEVMGVKKND